MGHPTPKDPGRTRGKRSRTGRRARAFGVQGAEKARILKTIAVQLDRYEPGKLRRLLRSSDAVRSALDDIASGSEGGEHAAVSDAPATLTGLPARSIDTQLQRDEAAEALAKARLRGRQHAAAVSSRHDMLTSDQMAERLGVTRDTVNRWRQSGRLLAVHGAARGFRYPAWQIDPQGRPLADMASVLTAADDPWAAYRWLSEAHAELDGLRGMDALRQGRSSELVALIKHFGETFG